MPQTTLGDVIHYLRRVCAKQEARGLSDGKLLERFLATRDEAAFAALVHRHGPMVLGVCERVLRDPHAAEDGFQATFMVLVRRAASIGRRQPLGGWLHAVAKRVALKARAKEAARRSRERRFEPTMRAEPLDELTWQELRSVLDEEIGRLPEKYRVPIVLCYLEGKSQEQAAKELGWPKTTVTRRVGRARELLRQQLVGRGIALSAGALATALGEKALAAPVAAMLTIKTVKAGMCVAAGKAVAAGWISAQAVALAEEAMTTMIGIKAKVVAIVLALGLAAGGAGLAGYSGLLEKAQPAKEAEAPRPVALPVSAQAQVQKNEAENLYRAMEKKIRDAKSLKVVFEVEGGKDAKAMKVKGMGHLSAGNKGRFEAEVNAGGKVQKLLIVSDGKQLIARDTENPALLPRPTPGRFDSDARAMVTRMGALMAAALFNLGDPPFESKDLDKAVSVSDFKLDGNEQIGKREARILEYAIEMFGEQGTVRLWIDRQTILPLKRRVLQGGNEDKALTEIYTEFVIEPQIEPKIFELPPQPKAAEAPANQDQQDGKEKKDAVRNVDFFKDPLPPGAVTRLGTVRRRPGSGPVSLHFLAEGKVLAVQGAGGLLSLQFWDAASGLLLRRLPSVPGGAFSADGKLLFTNDLRVFDVATGNVLRQLKRVGGPGNPHVNAKGIAPDGRSVAASLMLTDANGNITGSKLVVWEVATGKELCRLEGHAGDAWTLGYSPDSKSLASGGEDKTVRLWDLATGKETKRLEGHHSAVGCVAYSPRGNLLASAAEDGVVLLWDVASGKLLHRLQSGQGSPRVVPFLLNTRMTLCFSPDGKLLASIGSGGTICLWDAESGQKFRSWIAHADNVQSVDFSPDNKTLASVGNLDHAIRLWDIATGKERIPLPGHTGQVGLLQFAEDGKSLLSAGKDGKVLEWDAVTGRVRRQVFDGLTLPPEVGPLNVLDFSSEGKLLALVGTFAKDKTKPQVIHVWDTAAAKELQALSGSPGTRATAIYSPDGKLLVTGGSEGTRIWDVATGRQTHFLSGILPQAFSPDSKSLALSGRGAMHLWDCASQTERRNWETTFEGYNVFAFSPDSRFLAVVDYKAIRVWATDSGKEHLRFGQVDPKKGYFHPRSLAFSPSGRVLATGGMAVDHLRELKSQFDNTGAISLWDAWTGQKIGQFNGPQNMVWSLAFAPDGRTLASGGDDSTILLWDLTGQRQNGTSKASALTAADLEVLWGDLGGGDAAKVDRAIWTLARVPKQSVPLLSERLRPFSPADAQQVAKLVADVDSQIFAVRQKAAQALEELGEPAELALRKVLGGNPTLELRQRLERILAKRDSDPELVRRLRAIEALEHIATPEGRQVLEAMAQGAPNPRVAEAAGAALERLAKRP